MTRDEFRTLNKHGKVIVKPHFMRNSIPSSTDPTQDMPVANIVTSIVTGTPIKVKQNPMTFGAVPTTAHLSSIDKRNTDAFDAFAELHTSGKRISKVSSIKQPKEEENEK